MSGQRQGGGGVRRACNPPENQTKIFERNSTFTSAKKYKLEIKLRYVTSSGIRMQTQRWEWTFHSEGLKVRSSKSGIKGGIRHHQQPWRKPGHPAKWRDTGRRSRKAGKRDSPAAQGLELRALTAQAQVQSLVGERRSHKPGSVAWINNKYLLFIKKAGKETMLISRRATIWKQFTETQNFKKSPRWETKIHKSS